MNSIAVHARTPAIYFHFTSYLGILIPSAVLLLKNGIRKAGNLLISCSVAAGYLILYGSDGFAK